MRWPLRDRARYRHGRIDAVPKIAGELSTLFYPAIGITELP
jgi:hypothetical protein